MKIERRIFWLLSISVFLVLTSGCTSTHLRPIQVELEREGTGLQTDSGQKIDGYELLDGTHTDFNGWAKLTSQDSLSLWASELVLESDLEEESIVDNAEVVVLSPGPVLAVSAIKFLDVVESSPGKTVMAIIIAPVVLIVTVVGVSMIAADSGNLY